MKISSWPIKAALAGAISLITLSSARAATVYDNSVNDQTNRFNPGALEVGDEIVLAGTDRLAETFIFEYYGLSFSGNEQAQLRFYANDGTNSPSGSPVPNSVLYDSGLFDIDATPRSTLEFDLLSEQILLPNNFTWSVQFFGIAVGEEAGLDIYTPPVIGSSFVDYWENTGGTWSQRTNASFNMDFAATLTAVVPEPSTIALATLTGLGLCFVVFRRRR